MSIEKQSILHDLNSKEHFYSSAYSTPLMFSRDSSMETLSSFNVNFHSHNSTYISEHSTNPSGIISPSDIPDSPPRGLDDDDDDIDANEQQKTFIQPLNITRSTGTTIVERPDTYSYDDNDADSIRNYATSPFKITYDDYDDNDDNDSIHSSLSSLTLPPPQSSSSSTPATKTLLSSIDDLRNLKHNLSIINEESVHENHENPKSSFNTSETTTTTTDDDDDEDEDRKGKRLLFELIRQRLPHHHISLTSTSESSSKITDTDCHEKSKGTSSASSSINDQTMREDCSHQGLSSHDITIPSSAMHESGYDSLLPIGTAPKRSLSNASLSTTHSVTIKKKHRCDEENDDPMNGNNHAESLDDDDDDHYDKKAGEALLRNLIAQVLPSFNPRYLNGGDDEEEEDNDDVLSNSHRPSPISQTYSSSNASSVRSVDIEMNKKSEKNFCIRSNKTHVTDIIQKEKIHSKRTYIHRPVHQTKSSELRRLQAHSRR